MPDPYSINPKKRHRFDEIEEHIELNYDEPDAIDPVEYAMGRCHKMPDGSCGAAGSEHCEFECPFR